MAERPVPLQPLRLPLKLQECNAATLQRIASASRRKCKAILCNRSRQTLQPLDLPQEWRGGTGGKSTIFPQAALRRADRIHRAEGVLRHARLLSSEEFFSLYKELKLGIALGEVTSVTHEALNTLLINILPATLSLNAASLPKNDVERDELRANFVRFALEVKHE